MSIETWRERLADAISGERADWHRVEVRPDDILAALAAEADRATPDPVHEALLAVAEAARVVCDPMVQDGGGDRWWSAHDDLARALAALDAVEEPR